MRELMMRRGHSWRIAVDFAGKTIAFEVVFCSMAVWGSRVR